MEDESEERKIPKHIVAAYNNRVSYLKKGKEHSVKGDVITGIAYYHKYLNTLADFKGVNEKNLDPKLFNQQKDMHELLLISNVYWDLAKCYDRNPKTHVESKRCLNQFLKFTLGFKYQYLNAQLLRRYIKKKHALNKKTFEEAYKRLRAETKACYIATFCFGENHITTNELREFKKVLLKSTIGILLVDLYYSISPVLVNFLQDKKALSKLTVYCCRPPLQLIASLSRK